MLAGTVLGRICADKRQALQERKRLVSVAALAERAEQVRDGAVSGCFAGALKYGVRTRGFGVIAEIKKGSPSRGVIREAFDPAALACAYAEAGADVASVLTDTPYFWGRDEHLQEAHAAVPDMPLLRKDFMLDPYQIDEAAAMGAECVLLILAALSDEDAARLLSRAKELKLGVLAEVHNAEELRRALALPEAPDAIGVNNRNLKTLDVSLETSLTLLPYIPVNILKVSESGIRDRADADMLRDAGAQAFLIGETFMKSADPGAALSRFLQAERV